MSIRNSRKVLTGLWACTLAQFALLGLSLVVIGDLLAA